MLAWGAQSLASAHAEAALDVGIGRVVVVVREGWTEALGTLPRGADWCISREDESLGPAGSLRAARRALAREGAVYEWLAIGPVDVSPEAWAVVPELVHRVGTHDAAKPRYDARNGHPVLVRASALAIEDTRPLRTQLSALGERVITVRVGERAVLCDMDNPAQVREVLAAKSQRT